MTCKIRARPEITFKSLFLGILLGLLFAIANTYLGLKVGITISAAIPAAILSMTILRLIKRGTMFEHTIVATIASIGEVVAAGLIFTIPALFMLNHTPPLLSIGLLGICGGVLGILFMIPMRRFIIVEEDGILPFPEGTACGELLKAGEKKHPFAHLALWGILSGAIYKLCSGGLFIWKETASFTLKFYQNALVGINATPALLGVGFIIGPRITSVLFAGGALSWWVLIPLIGKVGATGMGAEEIWADYIRYIGAGAIATGGLLSFAKVGPLIKKTLITAIEELPHMFKSQKHVERTDRDIPMPYLLLGSLIVVLFLWLYPPFHLNLFTILLLTVLGFFFVAIASITTGLIGSSSSPVSGMTITVLLITCILYYIFGWTEETFLIAAVMMGSVISVTVCLAGATSQDLKLGYIVGATPRAQQIAELIGLILPAFAVGGTIFLLHKAYGFGTPELPAPQATLISLIAKGVITGELPIVLVGIGVVLGLTLHLMKIPVLPFAIGFYLPISLTTPIAIGGLVNSFIKSKVGIERGTLIASGLIAGDACMGVVIALLTVLGTIPIDKEGYFGNAISLALFGVLAIILYLTSRERKNRRN